MALDPQFCPQHGEGTTKEPPMSTSPSPMLKAVDLLRVDIDAMNLEEVDAHAVQVLDTIGALNEYINSPGPKSANALRNALNLVRKLSLHMARLRDLINARKLAAVMAGTAQAAGAASLGLFSGPIRP
jgi:hypothetical protein